VKKLYLTVGLPRSGKSTWAVNQKVPVVSRDAIRKAVHGSSSILKAEELITAIETTMVKSLFLAGHDTIIVDSTHLKKEYRDRWQCSPYSDLQWVVEYEFFKTDADTCIKRAIIDKREDLIPIIKAMASKGYS